MSEQQKVILLHKVTYNDNSYIVSGYARDLGRVSFIVKGSKKRTPMRQALMQPLSLVEISFSHTSTGRLPYAKESKIDYSYHTLPFNPIKSSIALFIAEVLTRALKENHPEPLLYDFIEQSLLFLDETEQNFVNFHLIFLCKLSRFLGFYPNTESYITGCWFDLNNGLFTTCPDAVASTLRPPETAIFYNLLLLNYDNGHTLKLSRDNRNALVEHLLLYYKLHLPEFGTVKSLEVLQQLFE